MAEEGSVSRGDIKSAIIALCERIECKYVNPFNKTPLQSLAPPLGKERYIIATGSYAFGKWAPGDNVRLVIMAKSSRSTLWGLLAEKLNLSATSIPKSTTIELSAQALSMTADWQPSLLAKFEALSGKNKVGS